MTRAAQEWNNGRRGGVAGGMNKAIKKSRENLRHVVTSLKKINAKSKNSTGNFQFVFKRCHTIPNIVHGNDETF